MKTLSGTLHREERNFTRSVREIIHHSILQLLVAGQNLGCMLLMAQSFKTECYLPWPLFIHIFVQSFMQEISTAHLLQALSANQEYRSEQNMHSQSLLSGRGKPRDEVNT